MHILLHEFLSIHPIVTFYSTKLSIPFWQHLALSFVSVYANNILPQAFGKVRCDGVKSVLRVFNRLRVFNQNGKHGLMTRADGTIHVPCHELI